MLDSDHFDEKCSKYKCSKPVNNITSKCDWLIYIILLHVYLKNLQDMQLNYFINSYYYDYYGSTVVTTG